MSKKFRVSTGYSTLYSLLSIFFILFAAFIWWLYPVIDWITIFYLTVSSAGLFCMLYPIIFDPLCGSFTVDEKGITMRTMFKSWHHPWETINDCGTTWARTANDGGTYYIFFSTRNLTSQEKQRFLNKTRRDLKDIAYFQYSEEKMAEIYPILPPEISAKVKESVDLAEFSMNNFERKHHK